MGRKSKLTDKQWAEIERRLIDGESRRALAKEFGLTETAIRKRLGSQVKEIVSVADQLLTADQSLKALPISSQVSAQNLFQRLRSISDHLASAAEYGSMTAHRLSVIAHGQTDLIDESASLDANADALKSVMAMTRGANDAATIGLNLLAANKDSTKALNAEAASADRQAAEEGAARELIESRLAALAARE